jgi:uncharacterized protein (TIGR02266 family)
MQPRDLRVDAQFHITFSTVDAPVVAYSANLSLGGLFLKTNRLLPIDTVISLVMHLPDGGDDVEVPCRVVFVRATDGEQSQGMGLKFIDPEDTVKQRIEWFIINSSPDANEVKSQSSLRKLNVVIVDDDRLQSDLASSAFKARGDIVRIARDGLTGLALCLEEKPDVILTDVQMPKMDGWQMVRLLRARPNLAKVPILFLTSLSSESDRLVGYRLGVEDYVTKPPDPHDLMLRVDRAVLRAEQIHRSASNAEREALRGELSQVGIQSILSFIEMERRTGVLRIVSKENARLEIRDGNIIRAHLESLAKATPRGQLFRILDLDSGRFEFVQGEVTGPDEIQLPTSNVLIEHARLRDEKGR